MYWHSLLLYSLVCFFAKRKNYLFIFHTVKI
jgi:hypothetical protein